MTTYHKTFCFVIVHVHMHQLAMNTFEEKSLIRKEEMVKKKLKKENVFFNLSLEINSKRFRCCIAYDNDCWIIVF